MEKYNERSIRRRDAGQTAQTYQQEKAVALDDLSFDSGQLSFQIGANEKIALVDVGQGQTGFQNTTDGSFDC